MPLKSENSTRRDAVLALVNELRPHGVFRIGDAAKRSDLLAADASGIEGLLAPLREKGSGLSEWLAWGEGAGAASVVFAALRAMKRPQEPFVLVEGELPLYPPAMEAWGMDWRRAVLVRPRSEAERHWAIEQALRCRGLGGVVAWCGRSSERALRRLQLAVEHGGGQGFLIRPIEARRDKCWGDVRFLVHPRPSEESDLDRGRRRVEIEVLAGRGGIAVAGQSAIAEICDDTGAVCLVSRLADPASAGRAAGAEGGGGRRV